ncbi:chromate transporter [Sorangium sp. So ce131]|uniref:chromate transporter n=1 Tax=Sorangium sp. So ce131 TaxID=3133282 RepID=UPI003F5FB1C0
MTRAPLAGPDEAPASVPAPAPSLGDLFLGFLGVSLSGFGGVLPFARREIVERRRWLTAQEFTDLLATCQFLPGPNIVNLSVAMGRRFHGAAGAASAVLGLLGAPVLLAIALGALYARFQHVHVLRGAYRGVAAGAAGLVVAMAAKITAPLVRQRPLATAPIALLAFVGAGLLRWPLPWILLLVTPLSVAAAFLDAARAPRARGGRGPR